MNKKILSFLLVMVMLVIAGCGAARPEKTAAPEKKSIRIGYQLSSSLTILAKAKGFFEEEFGKDGVEVAYNLFLAGPPMNEALAGGRIDIANMGPLPAITARAAGNDVKAIGRSYSDEYYYGLLTKPDSSIHSLQDLKGKKVAVQVGSGAHLFLMLLLKQNGLTNTDINIVNLPPADHTNALSSGNVDAIATWQPFVSAFTTTNTGHLLANSKNVIRTVGVYLASNEYGQKNPELIERFLKVHQRTVDYLKTNREEAIKIIAAESKFSPEAVAKSIETIDWYPNIAEDDIRTLDESKEFLKSSNVIKKDFNIKDLVDTRYLEKVGIR